MTLTAPTQTRSRNTLERLLLATEQLLADRAFRDISLAQITARAGVTVGAVYARVPDKDALLVALYERLATTIGPHSAEILNTPTWARRPLEQSLKILFQDLIAVYREHATIIKTLSAEARTYPPLRERMESANRDRVDALVGCVRAAKDIGEQSPSRSTVEFALLVTTGAAREAILFQEFWPGGLSLSDAALAKELVRVFTGYLERQSSTRRYARSKAGKKT